MNKILKIITAATAALIIQSTAIADVVDTKEEPKELKHYAYTQFGVSRTQYRRFKEVHNLYLRKAPKVAPMWHLGLGHKFTTHFRMEVNLQYGQLLYKAKGEFDEQLRQKVRMFGAMINGYYDLFPNKTITPYITAAGGLGINHVGSLHIGQVQMNSKNSKNFIWNVGAGFRTKLNRRFNLDLGYRYIYLGKAHTTDTNLLQNTQAIIPGCHHKIYGHQILGAISYNF